MKMNRLCSAQNQDALPRVAVHWKPDGHRKRGRPKTNWRKTVEAEAAAMGQSWATLRMLAQDRVDGRILLLLLLPMARRG
ncbi:hypothetical protein ElyMa_000039400 [Elysia marginata]|uniref:Uncharacterized protein n=1 Tax=Elysia marginata TaxID=1093978 RepID=A0AAV4ECM0_9GAST|nr:hypothetical protein ElyMa_000039400 [Elysia marginata]